MFLLTAVVAFAIAVAAPGPQPLVAGAEEPPLPEGWAGTVAVEHSGLSGSTSITATFDPTGFRRSQSFAEAFPGNPFFTNQAATSRMWQQDYSVTYSSSTSYPVQSGPNYCVPARTTTRSATHVETTHVDAWEARSETDQISIGWFYENLDPATALMIDLRGVMSDVAETTTTFGCGLDPKTTQRTYDLGFRFDLMHGFAGGLASQDVTYGVDAEWPMTPGTDGVVRLRGSKSFHGVLLGGDETDTSTITWDLELVPGEPDADGDGVADTDDACPLVPGPASNNGCPGPNDDCDGDIAQRGYVVADHTAEIDTLLGDPDLFRFEVSARWCALDGVIEIDVVDHQGHVELGATLGTALELLGFTFVYDAPGSSSIGTESGSTAEVLGIGEFDACFDWLALIGSGAGSRVIGKAARAMSRSIGKVVPTRRLTSVATIVEQSIASLDTRLIALADDLEAILLRQLDSILPSGAASSLAARIGDGVTTLADRFRADLAQGLETQLRSVLDLPSSAQRTALRNLRGSLGDLVAGALAGMFDLSSCFDIWTPEVTVTIPIDGKSSSSIDGYANPFLVVDGGITVDTR